MTGGVTAWTGGAGLRLPPRRASTILVEAQRAEQELYDGVSSLVRSRYSVEQGGTLDRLTLRLLQSEAGSSPAAVGKTMERLAERTPFGPDREALRSLVQSTRSFPSTSKADSLFTLLRSSPDRTLVFVSFRETLAFLERRLREQGLDPAVFHGGLTAAEKDAAIGRFRDGCPVLLTTEVGGEGRNLQFCHRLVNFDLPWNPMRIEQRIGRLHRIGQESEVEIFNFCSRGSVEDHLLAVLDRKINMFELVVGEVDMILGQMEDERDFSDRVLEAWAMASSEEEIAANFDGLADALRRAKTSYERAKSLDQELFGENYEVWT